MTATSDVSKIATPPSNFKHAVLLGLIVELVSLLWSNPTASLSSLGSARR